MISKKTSFKGADKMKNVLKAILPILFALSVHAADLDAPAKKAVTVRSEIQRGLAAVTELHEPEHPLYYHRAVTSIVYENQQRNDDTPAFVFAVNYAAWHSLWNALSARKYVDPFEAEIAAAHASICYTIALGIQKQMGLGENDLREAVGAYYKPNEATRFEALLKSKQFTDSYSLASSNASARH